MPTGLFIVLEGIDGAGTTTQAQLLGAWLEERGETALLTGEPTPARVGRIIRQILQHQLVDAEADAPLAVDEETMALLFVADRADHLRQAVLPALDAGRIVVSDRHYLSSVAYQSVRVDMAWVEELNAGLRRPDLTILLDIEPEVSLRRKRGQGQPAERYEKEAYLSRVRENYLLACEHARAAGERIEQIDGAQPIQAVTEQIRTLVAPLLAER